MCFPIEAASFLDTNNQTQREIKQGDLLRTVDSTGRRTVDATMNVLVTHAAQNCVKIVLSDNKTIELTEDHQIPTNHLGTWKPAGEVRIGDRLLVLCNPGGMLLEEIVKIEIVQRNQLYNIWMRSTPYVCMNGIVITSCCNLAKNNTKWITPLLAIPLAYARAMEV